MEVTEPRSNAIWGCGLPAPEDWQAAHARELLRRPSPTSMAAGGNAWCEANYGPHCEQEMVVVNLFGHQRSVNKEAHRHFLRLDHIFHEHDPKYYKLMASTEDTGCFACRNVGGADVWSMHAWALAGDTRWGQMPRGSDPFRSEIWLHAKDSVRQAEEEGFRWGGRWTLPGQIPDPMHLESRLTPVQIRERYDREGLKKDGFASLPNVATF